MKLFNSNCYAYTDLHADLLQHGDAFSLALQDQAEHDSSHVNLLASQAAS